MFVVELVATILLYKYQYIAMIVYMHNDAQYSTMVIYHTVSMEVHTMLAMSSKHQASYRPMS